MQPVVEAPEKDPAGQLQHMAEVAVERHEPAGQEDAHTRDPGGEHVLALQAEHAEAAIEAAAKVPAGQVLHALEAVEAA